MDNRIIIIAASVAFVALVAGGSYYFCHDENIYLKSLDDKDGCASAFLILNTDDPGTAEPLKQGAVVFTNTTIVSHSTGAVQWLGSPYYDKQRECIVAECQFEGEDYVFNMDIEKAGKVADLYVSDGSMVIQLKGVERGFSLVLTMSYDKLSDELVGDWTVGSAYEGWFTDGEIRYEPSEVTVDLSIKKSTGLLYRLTYNGKVSYCAWNFGIAYASNFDGAGAVGYIRPDGQDLVMTSIEDNGIGSVIRLESTDRDRQAPEVTASDAAAGEVPAAGTSWDAVKAYEIDGVTETDIIDRGYNFTMLRVEGDLIFYRVTSSIDDFRFVAVRAAQGFWLSADDEDYFKSMAYFESGVLYASYYEGGSNGTLYSIIFGDEEAVEPMDRSLVGKPYYGSQHSVEFMDGEVLDGPWTSDVSLSFVRQYGNVAMAETSAGLVDAKWGVAIQVSKPEGYLFMVEASAERFGEEFHGIYIGFIKADLSKISLSGALVRDDGDAAVFTQELYPSLKRPINDSRKDTMGFQEFKVRMLSLYEAFPMAIAMVMGALMVIRGSWQLYGAIVNGGTIPNMAAFLIMAVAGVFIIVWGRRDLVRTVGLYAITLGLTRVLMRYDVIVNPSSNILVVIINWILFILALNLIYTGVSFARGMVIRRASMMATAFAFIGLNVIMMAIPLGALGIQSLDDTTRLIEVVMYIVLILMLDAESIRYGTSDGRHARHLDRVRASYRAEPWAFITPDEAENLLSGKGPMWREIDDGIVEREMVLRVSGRDIETTIVVQKWCGEDFLRFNVTPNSGTIVFANKLAVDRIVRDGDRIRFYGRDGTDFVYSVKEALI